jgi:hypothetical protein
MCLMYFLVSFDFVSNILNPHSPKKKIMSNLMCWMFPMFIFKTLGIAACYFVIPCWHFHLFVVPHLSSSLVLLGWVSIVDQAKVILKPKHYTNLNLE